MSNKLALNQPVKTGSPRLLEQVRDRLRVKHYSLRTEQAYVQWIRRYIVFHDKRRPMEMGEIEVEAFLTSLAGSMGADHE